MLSIFGCESAQPESKLQKKEIKTHSERALFNMARTRHEFDLMKSPETNDIPLGIRNIEIRQAQQITPWENISRGEGFDVEFRGPDNIGGRTRALAFDISNPQIMLAGGTSSGLYRSINGGAKWERVSPTNATHSITAVAQDPRPGFQHIWYYGTGESLGNTASRGYADYYGQGIWRSRDSGETWERLAGFNTGQSDAFQCTDFVNRLVVHKQTGAVYAAVAGAIYRSSDGGSTWIQVLGPGCREFTNSGHFVFKDYNRNWTDIVISPSGEHIFAAFAGDVGNRGDRDDGIFHSRTGNQNDWQRIGGSNDTAVTDWRNHGEYGRIVMAVAETASDIVLYAMYFNNHTNDCLNEIAKPEADLFRWKKSNNSTSWDNLSDKLPNNNSTCNPGNNPFAVQYGYNMAIAVWPNDPDRVAIGGTNIYLSQNGFNDMPERIGGFDSVDNYDPWLDHHPDIHAILFHPNDKNIIYTGSDGGIHKREDNNGFAWNDLNKGYRTIQYYHVGIHPKIGDEFIVGGSQDNGVTLYAQGFEHDILKDLFADGCAIGISDKETVFFGFPYGDIRRVKKNIFGNYKDTIKIKPSVLRKDSGIFVTYFLLDPDNTKNLYYVNGKRIFRTKDAEKVDPDSDSNNWEELTGISGTVLDSIRCMAISRGDYGNNSFTQKLYLGIENGEVFRVFDPVNWDPITEPTPITPPNMKDRGLVSSISVNPYDDTEILATYSNFDTKSIWHATDAGSITPTWTNIEGNISETSVRSSAIIKTSNNTFYFVGTTVGLFVTSQLAGAQTYWHRVSPDDIGFSVVNSLALRASDNHLLIGTHGNGMFELKLSEAAAPQIYFRQPRDSRGESIGVCNSPIVQIPVDITGIPETNIEIEVKVDTSEAATARVGQDYELISPVNMKLDFPAANTSSQNIEIEILDDSLVEGDETIILTLTLAGTTNPAGAYNQSFTLTIIDDDSLRSSNTLIYEEGFESEISFDGFNMAEWAKGWFGPATNAGWEVSSISLAGGGTSKALFISNDRGNSSNYNLNQKNDALVRSEKIDASQYQNLRLKFDYLANGEPGGDYGSVLYSLNGDFFFEIEGDPNTGPYLNTPNLTTRVVELPKDLDNKLFYLGWRWTNNDNGIGNQPPFVIDNIELLAKSMRPVEIEENASYQAPLGPLGVQEFYDGEEIIARIENLSNHDFGCTEVTIDRAGQGANPFWYENMPSKDLTQKTVLVTPTFPNTNTSIKMTLFYTDDEVNSWESHTERKWLNDIQMVRTSVPIQSISHTNYLSYLSETEVGVMEKEIWEDSTNYSISNIFTFGLAVQTGFSAGTPGLPPLSTGFGSVPERSFLLGPNPFEDYLQLNISDGFILQEPLNISLFDIKGTLAWQTQLQPTGLKTYRFSIPELANGIYLARIRMGKNSWHKKLLHF